MLQVQQHYKPTKEQSGLDNMVEFKQGGEGCRITLILEYTTNKDIKPNMIEAIEARVDRNTSLGSDATLESVNSTQADDSLVLEFDLDDNIIYKDMIKKIEKKTVGIVEATRMDWRALAKQ